MGWPTPGRGRGASGRGGPQVARRRVPRPFLTGAPPARSSSCATCTATVHRCVTCSRPNPGSPASRSSARPSDAIPIHTADLKRRIVMHETRRTGVRLVLTNPADPSRLDDFSDWYDTYAAALTVPGYLADAFRFENPDASPGPDSPRYATIYDIVTSDPATAWPDTDHSPDYPTHLLSDPRPNLVPPPLRPSSALPRSLTRPPHPPC